jgi:phosphatidylserine decarboxylase
MMIYLFLGVLLALFTTLPLAWKWQLGMRRVGVTVFLLGILVAGLVGLLGRALALTNALTAMLVWFLATGMAVAILLYRFYRDPERTPPSGTNVMVSPADGVVIYVRRSANGVLPVSTKNGRDYKLVELTKTPLCTGDAIVVGISMSFLDVHVNRTPCSGRVIFRRHFPGLFGSLRHSEMTFENERATTVIEKDGFKVAVVQIASRLVRQIVVFVREGQEVALGQRMGVIRLGSQVDVVFTPAEHLKVMVKPGDQVRSGESIIAELG